MGIRKAKMEITEGMSEHGLLLLNGDDVLLRNLDHQPKQRITYFGCSEGCNVQAFDVKQKEEILSFRAEAGKLTIPVEMNLEGEHYVCDALAAVAVGLKLAVPFERIGQSLRTFRNISGRQEIYKAGGYTIINDCYNAGPESMAAALGVLGNRPGRHIAVLGDMLELGDCAPAEHEKVGILASQKADFVLAYGPCGEWVRKGAISGGLNEKAAMAFSDRQACADALAALAQKGDVLLFKGSHGMYMEIVLDMFLKKEK